MSVTIDEIKALEDRRYAAMVAADGEVLDELFADRALYTHSHSGRDTKAEFIDNLTSGRFRYRAVHRLEEEYVLYENAALVSTLVKLEISVGDVDRTVNARATITWVREGDRWLFAAWQSTPTPS